MYSPLLKVNQFIFKQERNKMPLLKVYYFIPVGSCGYSQGLNYILTLGGEGGESL